MKIICSKQFNNLDSMIQDMENALDDAQVNSATSITESSKVMASTNAYNLGEFLVEGWDILEGLGFSWIGENDELLACNNGDDLIVTDDEWAICYYSNIPTGEKDMFLDALLAEDCFPDLPEDYANVEVDEYDSIGDFITGVVGDFGV